MDFIATLKEKRKEKLPVVRDYEYIRVHEHEITLRLFTIEKRLGLTKIKF